MVEWIVSIILALVSGVVLVMEGKVFLFFLIPAVVCSPIVLDFLYNKGILITNTLKWVIIFVFCILGTIFIVNKEVEKIEDIEVINPMDGLVLNEQKILRMDEDGSVSEGILPDELDGTSLGENGDNLNDGMLEVNEEVNYTVQYFYDEVLVDSATDTITGKGGDTIGYVDIKDKSLGMYELDYIENLPLTLTADANTLVKIHYVKQKYDTSYIIKYYYDGVFDNTKTEHGTGKTGDVIKEYPNKSKDGLIPIRAVNFPLKLSSNEEENEMRIYYGFAKNTEMEEVGIVDGIAPSIILRKRVTIKGDEVDQIECPVCGSLFDKDTVVFDEEENTVCPVCESEITLKTYNEDGEEIIDNPRQQQIEEKYALNLQTREIHNPLCYYVRKIPSEFFKATNDSLDTLEAQGFHKCKKCNPK